MKGFGMVWVGGRPMGIEFAGPMGICDWLSDLLNLVSLTLPSITP